MVFLLVFFLQWIISDKKETSISNRLWSVHCTVAAFKLQTSDGCSNYENSIQLNNVICIKTIKWTLILTFIRWNVSFVTHTKNGIAFNLEWNGRLTSSNKVYNWEWSKRNDFHSTQINWYLANGTKTAIKIDFLFFSPLSCASLTIVTSIDIGFVIKGQFTLYNAKKNDKSDSCQTKCDKFGSNLFLYFILRTIEYQPKLDRFRSIFCFFTLKIIFFDMM